MAWFAGTDRGEHYQSILAHGGEGDYTAPGASERSLGSLVSPVRAGSVTSLVNHISAALGMDVAGWRVDRLLDMAAEIEQSRQAQVQDVPEGM